MKEFLLLDGYWKAILKKILLLKLIKKGVISSFIIKFI